MLTPSPWISPSSMMMSPMLIPMRKTIRLSQGHQHSGPPDHPDGAGHRIHDASELDEDAVRGRFVSAMLARKSPSNGHLVGSIGEMVAAEKLVPRITVR